MLPSKNFPESLLNSFLGWAEMSIDEKGITTTYAMQHDLDDKLAVSHLAVDHDQAMDYFWHQVCNVGCKAIIMGLDRYTKPGQGTDFRDVYTLFMWWDDPEIKWHDSYQVAVLNYQHEPRILRLDWDNTFWNNQLIREMRASRPRMKITVKKGPMRFLDDPV